MRCPFNLDIDLKEENRVRGSPIEIEPGIWEVRSGTNPEIWYTVEVSGGGLGFRCNCIGYGFRFWCSHCDKVKAAIGDIPEGPIDIQELSLQELLI